MNPATRQARWHARQACPICGAGPFLVVAQHIARKHPAIETTR